MIYFRKPQCCIFYKIFVIDLSFICIKVYVQVLGEGYYILTRFYQRLKLKLHRQELS